MIVSHSAALRPSVGRQVTTLMRPSVPAGEASASHAAPRAPSASTNVETCASTRVSVRPGGTAHGIPTRAACAMTAASVETWHGRGRRPCQSVSFSTATGASEDDGTRPGDAAGGYTTTLLLLLPAICVRQDHVFGPM